ncbi:MAG: hypothetical protein JSV78_09155 [Phycisphaerales bacterium]|nr:MAG: hypothetical protein JSV78_09155 [Phycisphaerales bacterium]
MQRRTRRTRFLKWLGLVMCALIVVAWLVSLRWGLVYQGREYLGGFTLGQGGLVCARELGQGWHALDMKNRDVLEGVWERRWPDISFDVAEWGVLIPLWIPFVVLAVPTAILWWRDRRNPPGHCRNCGYNLTGNISGICPECGGEVKG